MKIPAPTFQFEQPLWESGKEFIAGVDEVGRGAFAGPVVTAAVILPKTFVHESIHDSKLLTAKLREELCPFIKKHAICFSIAEVPVEIINKIGIGKATQVCFKKAIDGLERQPDHILIDAFYIDGVEKERQTPIIKGDQKSLSIAAASIIAKVYRDGIMKQLGSAFEKWGFAKHKGYGTRDHRDAIEQFGLCSHHRTSFSLEKFL